MENIRTSEEQSNNRNKEIVFYWEEMLEIGLEQFYMAVIALGTRSRPSDV
jgi:hypothetical protein